MAVQGKITYGPKGRGGIKKLNCHLVKDAEADGDYDSDVFDGMLHVSLTTKCATGTVTMTLYGSPDGGTTWNQKWTKDFTAGLTDEQHFLIESATRYRMTLSSIASNAVVNAWLRMSP